MAKVKQVARKPFRYAGESLSAGQTFFATAKDARTLKAIGKSRDPEISDGDADAKLQKLADMVKREVPVTPTPRRRGRPPGPAKKAPAKKSTPYRRRDMKPEDMTQAEAPTEAQPEVPTETTPPPVADEQAPAEAQG